MQQPRDTRPAEVQPGQRLAVVPDPVGDPGACLRQGYGEVVAVPELVRLEQRGRDARRPVLDVAGVDLESETHRRPEPVRRVGCDRLDQPVEAVGDEALRGRYAPDRDYRAGAGRAGLYQVGVGRITVGQAGVGLVRGRRVRGRRVRGRRVRGCRAGVGW